MGERIASIDENQGFARSNRFRANASGVKYSAVPVWAITRRG